MSNLTAEELENALKLLRGNIDQLFLIVMGILVFREYNLHLLLSSCSYLHIMALRKFLTG